MAHKLWSNEELILAFNLYLQIPFGKMHSKNAEIIQLSEIINRTPSAVAMRLSNFASIDPYHQNRGVGGLSGGKRQVEPIWKEFIDNKEELLFESERILAKMEQNTIETKFADILLDLGHLQGESKLREIKTRINQNVFRKIVLANYSSTCAVSGIDHPELLIASHIIPWSKNQNERLNPENGICLSPLYDKAFDKGLISLNFEYEMILSNVLKEKRHMEYFYKYFSSFEGKKIRLPEKYLPSKKFIEYHNDLVFLK